MGKISNNELAAVLVERKRLSKKNASRFVNELFNVIRQGLQNERLVKVKGLGTFKIVDVDDRESVNVNTGERVLIEGHSKISFTPDALMKELVNKPFSQFETVVLKDGVDFEDVPQGEETEEPTIEEELIAEPEPEPVAEPEVESEPVIEPEPELVAVPEPTSFYEEDIEPSSAPLVDFVTPDDVSEETPNEFVEDKSEEIIEEEPEYQPEEEVEEPKEAVEPEETKEVEESEKVTESEEPEETTESEESEEAEEPESPLYDFDEEESGSRWKTWLLVAALCCACFVGGYFVGQYFANKPATDTVAQPEVKTEVKPVVQPKAQPEVQPEAPSEKESDVALEPKVEEQADAKPEAKPESEVKPEAKPEVKPETKPETKVEAKSVAPTESAATLDQYEKMDVRVRTGAYRIVGTDHVEKAKAGDNLSRICKRTIGEGMECYLEVYNGIKGGEALKAGQQIKIPKLELKKKKAKLAN